MGMIDISDKNIIQRGATTTGKIYLNKNTIKQIVNKKIKKGDPLHAAEITAILAVKKTPELIPHCHQIPIEGIELEFNINSEKAYIEVKCQVKSTGKTGVEIDSLIGTTIALNTILDMVKYLEKDEFGMYPRTKISDIKIVKKTKGVNHVQ